MKDLQCNQDVVSDFPFRDKSSLLFRDNSWEVLFEPICQGVGVDFIQYSALANGLVLSNQLGVMYLRDQNNVSSVKFSLSQNCCPNSSEQNW